MAAREYLRGTLVIVEHINIPKIDGKIATVVEDSASWKDEVELVVDGWPGHIFVIPVNDIRVLN